MLSTGFWLMYNLKFFEEIFFSQETAVFIKTLDQPNFSLDKVNYLRKFILKHLWQSVFPFKASYIKLKRKLYHVQKKKVLSERKFLIWKEATLRKYEFVEYKL